MRHYTHSSACSPFWFAEPIKEKVTHSYPIIHSNFDLNRNIVGSAKPWWEVQPTVTYCAANLLNQ